MALLLLLLGNYFDNGSTSDCNACVRMFLAAGMCGIRFCDANPAVLVQMRGAVQSALEQQAPLNAAQEEDMKKDMQLFLNCLQNSAYSQGLSTGTQTAAAQVLGNWR